MWFLSMVWNVKRTAFESIIKFLIFIVIFFYHFQPIRYFLHKERYFLYKMTFMTEAVFAKNRFPQKNKTFLAAPNDKKSRQIFIDPRILSGVHEKLPAFLWFSRSYPNHFIIWYQQSFLRWFSAFFFSIVIPQLRTASGCFLYNGKVGSSSQTLHFLHNPRKNRKIRRPATAFPCFHIGIHSRKCRIFRQKALIAAGTALVRFLLYNR